VFSLGSANSPHARAAKDRALADAQAALRRYEADPKAMASLFEAGVLAYAARGSPRHLRDSRGRPVSDSFFAAGKGYEFDLVRWLHRITEDSTKLATFRKALADGERLLQRNPDELLVIWWLCKLNVVSSYGDKHRAIQLAERWRRIEPKNPWPVYWIAASNSRLVSADFLAGRPVDAGRAQRTADGFRRVLEMAPNFSGRLHAQDRISWLTRNTPAK
jgi:hypothetical protein